MIRGVYGGRHLGRSVDAITPVPFLEGLLWLPEFDADRRIIFLVDSGADLTVLNPRDSSDLLRPDDWGVLRLREPRIVGGAGQWARHYPAQAVLQLVDEAGSLEQVQFTIHVGEPDPRTSEMESLLGRDVLGLFKVTFDHNMALTLER
ncbi:MAG TPA: hypothetical protein VJP07_04840 [Dehalococcoidia bacterium]|nr:hypothetical protein [Dehalococcoidia bacterium]